jgi:hypothetical protein
MQRIGVLRKMTELFKAYLFSIRQPVGLKRLSCLLQSRLATLDRQHILLILYSLFSLSSLDGIKLEPVLFHHIVSLSGQNIELRARQLSAVETDLIGLIKYFDLI